MSTRNIEIVQGDSWFLALSMQNADGTPEDITGDSVIMTVKANLTDSDDDALVQVLVTSHVNPTEGLTGIGLTSPQTINFPAVAWYDVVWKHLPLSTNRVTTLTRGRIFTDTAVTQNK